MPFSGDHHQYKRRRSSSGTKRRCLCEEKDEVAAPPPPPPSVYMPDDMLHIIISQLHRANLMRFGLACTRHATMINELFDRDFHLVLRTYKDHASYLYSRKTIQILFLTSHPRSPDSTDDNDVRVLYFGQSEFIAPNAGNLAMNELSQDPARLLALQHYDNLDVYDRLGRSQDSTCLTTAVRKLSVHLFQTLNLDKINESITLQARSKKAICERWKTPIRSCDVAFDAYFHADTPEPGDAKPFYALRVKASMTVYVDSNTVAELTITLLCNGMTTRDLAWIPLHEISCNCKKEPNGSCALQTETTNSPTLQVQQQNPQLNTLIYIQL